MNTEIVPGGKLKMIVGPMFSGKSTDLINSVRRYRHKNKKTVLVKYGMDNRYSAGDFVVTHDLQESPALKCTHLREILDELFKYDVIGVDEGQFYTDLVDICEELVLNGKQVIVSALSGNFKMEPFENVSKLISKADKIKLKKAICFFCHEKAAFSLRTIANEEEVLIGAADKYRPTCRSCHIKNNCKSA